jgi:hypothetical protein
VRWPDARLRAMVLALALLAGPATAADAPATPALSASAVMQAASAVEADPQLGGFEKGRTLKFKTRGSQPKDDDVNWWINLFKSLSFGLRLVVWLVVAALFILALLRLRDWLKRSGPAAVQAPDAPTHIGSLDIRPESLPDDIGRAARHLLEQGALRPALSLLYRGALSRLVHVHGVPIRAASTERDCLQLAAARLQPAPQAFLAELVSAWQAVAYAHRELPHDDAAQLCLRFEAAMAPPAGARA